MTRGAKKILLVEDDNFLAEMYKKKFLVNGFKVEIANNGEEGLKKVKVFMPDMILLDVIMPKMNGWEFLEKLRADFSSYSPPVMLLTNLSQVADIHKGMSYGVVDYLIKAHFTPGEVIKKVKETLEK